MKRMPHKNRIGTTLVELMLAVLLLGVIFLAVSALFVTSQRFHFTSNEKVIASYELQYAIEHIYKNAMQGIGDVSTPPITVTVVPSTSSTLSININTNDPLTSSNYGNVTTYTYTYTQSDGVLNFNDGSSTESLVPKVTVTSDAAEIFSLEGNLLKISFTGEYKNESLKVYSACYPRLGTFN